MGLSVAEGTTDTDDEHTAFFTGNQVFTFFGRFVGPQLTQLLGVDKEDFFVQLGLNLGILLANVEFGTQHG